MLKLFSRKPDTTKCSFCERQAGKVRHLVEGKSATICDRCVVDSLVALDGDAHDWFVEAMRDLLLLRAEQLSGDQRSAVVQALAALGRSGVPFFNVVDRLAEQGHAAACHSLLRGVDTKLWRGRDWVTFTWCCSVLGQFAEVPEVMSSVPPEVFEFPDDAHLLRMNVIWASCHLAVPPSHEELSNFLLVLDSCRQHWTERSEDPSFAAATDRYRSSLEGTSAKCHVLLGQTDAALACLGAAEATAAGVQPSAALLWGDILAARSDPAGARQKWLVAANSKEAEHQGILREQLRTRLPELPRED
ncbi:MAG TPA: ClpX C4-type zinc finger protein [Polyangiaceae bacterium]|nr:ClpX C4-type zinc finger protein [Polyangiaceae bacterium]